MVKDHSDSEKGNPLLPHRLLLSINSKVNIKESQWIMAYIQVLEYFKMCLCDPLLALIVLQEGNVLLNDVLNTFYILLYGIEHKIKNHS